MAKTHKWQAVMTKRVGGRFIEERLDEFVPDRIVCNNHERRAAYERLGSKYFGSSRRNGSYRPDWRIVHTPERLVPDYIANLDGTTIHLI